MWVWDKRWYRCAGKLEWFLQIPRLEEARKGNRYAELAQHLWLQNLPISSALRARRCCERLAYTCFFGLEHKVGDANYGSLEIGTAEVECGEARFARYVVTVGLWGRREGGLSSRNRCGMGWSRRVERVEGNHAITCRVTAGPRARLDATSGSFLTIWGFRPPQLSLVTWPS